MGWLRYRLSCISLRVSIAFVIGLLGFSLIYEMRSSLDLRKFKSIDISKTGEWIISDQYGESFVVDYKSGMFIGNLFFVLVKSSSKIYAIFSGSEYR